MLVAFPAQSVYALVGFVSNPFPSPPVSEAFALGLANPVSAAETTLYKNIGLIDQKRTANEVIKRKNFFIGEYGKRMIKKTLKEKLRM